jgi:hypothetical protein
MFHSCGLARLALGAIELHLRQLLLQLLDGELHLRQLLLQLLDELLALGHLVRVNT